MPDPAKCVYCRAEPVAERYKPFCSERCKMADLGRWLKGDYAVPVKDPRAMDGVDTGDLDLGLFDIEDEQ